MLYVVIFVVLRCVCVITCILIGVAMVECHIVFGVLFTTFTTAESSWRRYTHAYSRKGCFASVIRTICSEKKNRFMILILLSGKLLVFGNDGGNDGGVLTSWEV